MNYVPPKTVGASLLELEAAILQASDLEAITQGQETFEKNYNGSTNYWE